MHIDGAHGFCLHQVSVFVVLTAWMVMRSIERRILKPVGRGFYHGTRGDYPGTTDEVVRRLPVTCGRSSTSRVPSTLTTNICLPTAGQV